MTTDQAGNFYLTDEEPVFPSEIPHVLKVGSDGSTTVIAGNGPDGFSGDDGPATLAVLNEPQGLAVDAAGNIYIADTAATTGCARSTPRGTSTRLRGTARFNSRATMDRRLLLEWIPSMWLWTARETCSSWISSTIACARSRPNNTISTVVGTGLPGFSGDGGPAAEAELTLPTGIALDRSGNIYIADAGNEAVRRVTTGGADHNHRRQRQR